MVMRRVYKKTIKKYLDTGLSRLFHDIVSYAQSPDSTLSNSKLQTRSSFRHIGRLVQAVRNCIGFKIPKGPRPNLRSCKYLA